jgi:5-methylcytosine-specific restriction endonuclease McrA
MRHRVHSDRSAAYEHMVVTYQGIGMTLAEANQRAFQVAGKWDGGYRMWGRPPSGTKCAACGTDDNLVWDHIIPRLQGGWDTKANLQPLCCACNTRKRNQQTDYR